MKDLLLMKDECLFVKLNAFCAGDREWRRLIGKGSTANQDAEHNAMLNHKTMLNCPKQIGETVRPPKINCV